MYELIISFAAYLTVILSIGVVSFYHVRKNMVKSSGAEFLLGGRSTHWLLTALSAHAADMSDWLFMAFPAAVYLSGGYSLWIAIGLIIGMMFSWQFIAMKLRNESERYHGVTIASFLSNRFDDKTGAISCIAALISLLFFIIYLAAGLKGIGFVLKSVFNINYHVGLLISIVVVLFYTILGGFTSVAIIDLFQGCFLLGMILLVPIWAYFNIGGLQSIFDAACMRNVSLSLFHKFDFRSLISILLNPLAWGLGYFGMPHILTKFMGAKKADQMHKSKYVGLIWMFLALSAAAAVGIIGLAYFPTGVPEKTELIFVKLTQQLFSPWSVGIILCAILAATISTVDTQLLVLAGIMTQDLYRTFLRTNALTSELLCVYRWSLGLAALGGLFFAWNETSTIMELVSYGWSGLGASFGPVMLLALFSEKINKYGVVAAMIAGAIVSISWQFIAPFITTVPVYSIVPAYGMSFLVAYVVSSLTGLKKI